MITLDPDRVPSAPILNECMEQISKMTNSPREMVTCGYSPDGEP